MKTKAAVLVETDKVELMDLEIPKLKHNQYLVKIQYASLCGSQINEVKGKKGPDKYLPHLFGHEAIGTVVDHNFRQCEKIPIETKVLCSWIPSGRGNCDNINYNRVNAGPIATFTQYAVISGNNLHCLPHDLILHPWLTGLGCSIPTAISAIQSSHICYGNNILVVGAGAVGLAMLLYVEHYTDSIFIYDIYEDKLNYALSIAYKHKDHIKYDYIFDCTGSINVPQQYLKNLNSNGMLVIVGNPIKGKNIQIDPYDLILNGYKITGHTGANANMEHIVSHYTQHSRFKKFSKIYGGLYSLEDINQAITDFSVGKSRKPIIKCQL